MRPNGVHLDYAIRPGHQAVDGLSHPLFELLAAIRSHGSLQRAAASVGASYRQVWSALKRWEAEFGRPLVAWDQGNPVQLTPHALALLDHERLLRARFAPQLGALRAELERLFERAAGDELAVLELPAVADPALDLLREAARERHGLHLALRDASSLDALRALVEGRAALAAFTLPEPGDDPAFDTAHRALAGGRFAPLVALRRTLGFILAGEAPAEVAALASAGARFAAPAPGSASDAVWQRLCRGSGIATPRPVLADAAHDAIATAVGAGFADIGFGSEAAAAAAELGFVPLAHEHLLLAAAADAAPAAALVALREAVADAGWRQAAAALGGVVAADPGEVVGAGYSAPIQRTASSPLRGAPVSK